MKSDLHRPGCLPFNVTPKRLNPWLFAAICLFILAVVDVTVVGRIRAHRPAGVSPAVLMNVILVSFGIFGTHRSIRLRGRGVTIGKEGLSPTLDGEILWTVPWNRIGAIRRERQQGRGSLTHPEDYGPTVHDELGSTLFVIPFQQTMSRMRAPDASDMRTNMFWVEIKRLLPPDAVFEERTEPSFKVPSRKHLTRQGYGSALSFIAGAVTVGPALSLVSSRSIFGFSAMAVSTLCLVVGASLGYLTLQQWSVLKHPERFDPALKPRVPDPVEGPHLEVHLVRHGMKPPPIPLEEGKRYRAVDAELRRSFGRASNKLFSLFILVPTVAALVVIGLSKGSVVFFGFFLAMYLTLMSLVTWSVWTGSATSETLDDTVVRVDDEIVVVRPDGSHLRFPTSQLNDDATAMRQRQLFGRTEVLRNGKDRYFLDRTRLFASEIPLDLEALAIPHGMIR